jgi:hypothetical protein
MYWVYLALWLIGAGAFVAVICLGFFVIVSHYLTKFDRSE